MYTPIDKTTIAESCVSTLEKSEDPIHRWLSLIVLRLAGDGRDDHMDMLFNAAERVLKEDPSAIVRQLAAWVLRDFPAHSALNTLTSGLADKDWEVRFEVVESLASLAYIWDYYQGSGDDEDNDDNDDDGTKEVMDDRSHYVKSAIGGLLLALKDNRPEVSLRAAFRLSRLNPCKVRSEIKKMLPECAEFYS
jgi:hypothetical protein